MATPAKVKEIAPKLAECSEAEVQVYLDLASAWVGKDAFGSRYDSALALLAAHFITMEKRGGKGQVTSQSAGGVSRSYASLGDDVLSQTSYGALFVSLRRTLVLTPVILGGPY